MQDITTTDTQQKSLDPVIRFGLAAAVALGLAGVISVATSASHTAVSHTSARIQDTTRYVKLPPVEIVGRRELAMGPASAAQSAAAASTGCLQPS